MIHYPFTSCSIKAYGHDKNCCMHLNAINYSKLLLTKDCVTKTNTIMTVPLFL